MVNLSGRGDKDINTVANIAGIKKFKIMSRISKTFSLLKKSNNKKALIPFITAGDPSIEMTNKILHQLVKSGADMIELGIPFSDPMADGPVIQRASEKSARKQCWNKKNI